MNYALDFLRYEDELPENEHQVLMKVRRWAQESVKPDSYKYWNDCRFPEHLIEEIAELDILGLVRQKGYSHLLYGLVTAEIHRADGSTGTFFSGQDSLFTSAVELLGSEELKKELVSDLYSLKTTGVLAITEPEAGSDVARGMRTTAKKVEGGWVLNGAKTWIGNATFSDYVAVFARDEADDQCKGFIVDTSAPGYRAEYMDGRITVRSVQNSNVYLDNVFVPDRYKLEKANSFAAVNEIFRYARFVVGWQAVGLQKAAVELALEYVTSREQFGKKLAKFQLVQSKLVTMESNLATSTATMARIAELKDTGRVRNETSAMAKALVTKLTRETVSLGRELMGGNGLLTHNHMAKVFCDAEALYTYEGTYDINQLITGRALTGIQAFV